MWHSLHFVHRKCVINGTSTRLDTSKITNGTILRHFVECERAFGWRANFPSHFVPIVKFNCTYPFPTARHFLCNDTCQLTQGTHTNGLWLWHRLAYFDCISLELLYRLPLPAMYSAWEWIFIESHVLSMSRLIRLSLMTGFLKRHRMTIIVDDDIWLQIFVIIFWLIESKQTDYLDFSILLSHSEISFLWLYLILKLNFDLIWNFDLKISCKKALICSRKNELLSTA